MTNDGFPTFWEWLKELWKTDRWFFFMAFAFAGFAGLATFCLLVAVQR
jgi:hypothetical protein